MATDVYYRNHKSAPQTEGQKASDAGAVNKATASADTVRALASRINEALARDHKVHLAWFTNQSNVGNPDTSLRCRVKMSPNGRLRARVVLSAVRFNAASKPDPYIQFQVTDLWGNTFGVSAPSNYTHHHNHRASEIGPTNFRVVDIDLYSLGNSQVGGRTFDVALVQNDLCQVISCTLYEHLRQTVNPLSETNDPDTLVDVSLMHVGGRIYDATLQSLWTGLRAVYEQQGMVHFAWSQMDSAHPLSVTSTTFVNPFDATTAWTSSTYGFWTDTQYHGSLSDDSVGVVLWAVYKLNVVPVSARISATNVMAPTGSTSSLSTYTTASTSPTSNTLLLFSARSKSTGATNPPIPTVTGLGLTWTQINTVLYNGSPAVERLTLFRACGVVTTGTISIAFGGVAQANCAWNLDQVTGADVSGGGGDAIAQSATNTSSGSSTCTVTLAAFGSASDGTYSTWAGLSTNSINPDGGWTELADAVVVTTERMETQYRNDNDTSAVAQWTLGATSILAGIACEIRPAPSLSGGQIEVVRTGGSVVAGPMDLEVGPDGVSAWARVGLQTRWPSGGAQSAQKVDVWARAASTVTATTVTIAACGIYEQEPVDPRDIPGLVVWLAADKITGLGSGASVTTWSDASGSANHATQGTAAKKPTYQTAVWQNLPMVRFDGVDDYLSIADSASYKQSSLTVFLVCRVTGLNSSGNRVAVCYPHNVTHTSPFFRWAMVYQATPNLYLPVDADVSATATSYAFGAQPRLWSYVTASRIVYTNGRQNLNGTDATITYPNAVGLYVGADVAGGENFVGDIGELLIFSGQLADDKRAKVEMYLSEKWGLGR